MAQFQNPQLLKTNRDPTPTELSLGIAHLHTRIGCLHDPPKINLTIRKLSILDLMVISLYMAQIGWSFKVDGRDH